MVGVWLGASAPLLQPGQRLLLAGPCLCRPTDGTPGRVPPPGGRAAAGRVSPGGAAAGQGEPSPDTPAPERGVTRLPRRRAIQLGYLQPDPAEATGSGSGTREEDGLPREPRGRASTRGLASRTRAFFFAPSVALLRSVGAAAGIAALSSPRTLGADARRWGRGKQNLPPSTPETPELGSLELPQPFCPRRWGLPSPSRGGVQEEVEGAGRRRDRVDGRTEWEAPG